MGFVVFCLGLFWLLVALSVFFFWVPFCCFLVFLVFSCVFVGLCFAFVLDFVCRDYFCCIYWVFVSSWDVLSCCLSLWSFLELVLCVCFSLIGLLWMVCLARSCFYRELGLGCACCLVEGYV